MNPRTGITAPQQLEREFPWLWVAYLLAAVLGAFAPPLWEMLK